MGATCCSSLHRDPITEPFATFLVEASWARGRIQREYTVLFDPPAFAPQQAAAAPPVAAPTAGGNGGSQISRAPARPQVAPGARPRLPGRRQPRLPRAGGGDYKVPRGDSLSAIAVSHYGEAEIQQAMIAIYRANPAGLRRQHQSVAGRCGAAPAETTRTSRLSIAAMQPPRSAARWRSGPAARAGGRRRCSPRRAWFWCRQRAAPAPALVQAALPASRRLRHRRRPVAARRRQSAAGGRCGPGQRAAERDQAGSRPPAPAATPSARLRRRSLR